MTTPKKSRVRIDRTPPRQPLPQIIKPGDLKPREPWEQQEGESDKAFRMFKVYLELGPQRTYRATAEKCNRALEIVKIGPQFGCGPNGLKLGNGIFSERKWRNMKT